MANLTETTKKQNDAINALLVTHRELTAVDLVKFTTHWMAKGGIVILIYSNEKYFRYHILANGEMKGFSTSLNTISFTEEKYF